MSLRLRRAAGRQEAGEVESDYVAMTDMMVGVLFIFIIMLCFFALQYKQTTVSLTSAKDAQTAVLLQTANDLRAETVQAEIDRTAHVVCLPGSLFGADGDRKCFAYTGEKPVQANAADRRGKIVASDRAAFMGALDANMRASEVPAHVAIDNANLSLPADQLFIADSAALTPEGRAAAARIARTLLTNLPCYSHGVAPSASCANEARMSSVNVQIDASFDAFTAEGRAASALALQRSVAFHDALIAAAPDLARLRNAPDGEALLRVSSYQQSTSSGGSQTLAIQFHMQP